MAYGKGGKSGNYYTSPNQATQAEQNKGDALLDSNEYLTDSVFTIESEPLPEYYEQRIDLNVPTKVLTKQFGRDQDYIELHVYDQQGTLLISDQNFTEYTLESPTNTNNSTELRMNTIQVLNNRGFFSGKYNVILNIQRKKIIDNELLRPFSIRNISSTRREIKAIVDSVPNEILETYVKDYISEINSSVFFKDFILNFGNDTIVPCINIKLNRLEDKYEILFRSFEEIPNGVDVLSKFSVAEDITDRIVLPVDLGNIQVESLFENISGPNFRIDVRQHNSLPSSFKNYDEILKYQITSSYENLLSKLENKPIIDIDYDYIKPVSESFEGENLERPYHFENFVHYSSAIERVKNFEYKLKLIELYDSQIADLSSMASPSNVSLTTITNKNNIQDKKTNLIKGFDGYEQFLYFDNSNSFASWPKETTTSNPNGYILYSITSSEAINWLGSENNLDDNYGGMLLSASLFDKQNQNRLSKLLPTFISDNNTNIQFKLFLDMVGQHFDHIWTYIKHVTEINDTHHVRGVSQELVYVVLKALGIETFDQFENANLIEYILGQGTTYSAVEEGGVIGDGFTIDATPLNTYDAPVGQTLITASNDGSVPKQEIVKRVWKRLYHNAPHLLKTKGTERGLRALMSCYGVPSSILNVKEFGGPTRDKTQYKTFTYDKDSLAYQAKQTFGNVDGVIQTNWPGSENVLPTTTNTYIYGDGTGNDLALNLSASAKTITFRVRPEYTTGTTISTTTTGDPTADQMLFRASAGANSLANSLVLTLRAYTGDDIYEPNDSTDFAILDFYEDNTLKASTEPFPAYNGNFWNIFLGTNGTKESDSEVKFGAYQANFNKNVFSYTASYTQTEAERAATWGDPYYNNENNAPLDLIRIGAEGPSATQGAWGNLGFSGSLQEIVYYWHQSGSFEMLTHETLTKQALTPFMYAGNHPSSSYNEVIFRMPLGSNNQQAPACFESFHPDIEQTYVTSMLANSGNGSLTQIEETHHLVTPDTVGRSMTNKKVRIDNTTEVNDDWLSTLSRTETSLFDIQPPDYEDLGVYLSPANEINEDIIYTLGGFRLDDYIGSPLPSAQTSQFYPDLKELKNYYFRKVDKKYNYFDYIKLIQQLDHTLFKLIEQFVPARANLKTGLLIEPHYLERTKFKRNLPTREAPYNQIEDGIFLPLPSITGSSVVAFTAQDTTSEFFSIFTITQGESATATFELKAASPSVAGDPTIQLTNTEGISIIFVGKSDGTANGAILGGGGDDPLEIAFQMGSAALDDTNIVCENLIEAVLNIFVATGTPGISGVFGDGPDADNFPEIFFTQILAGPDGNTDITYNDVFESMVNGTPPSAFAGGTGDLLQNGSIGFVALEETVTIYQLVEQGTNATINVMEEVLNEIPNLSFNAESCQSPIIPYTGTQPDGYKAFRSNILLGNATKGRKSSKYFKARSVVTNQPYI